MTPHQKWFDVTSQITFNFSNQLEQVFSPTVKPSPRNFTHTNSTPNTPKTHPKTRDFGPSAPDSSSPPHSITNLNLPSGHSIQNLSPHSPCHQVPKPVALPRRQDLQVTSPSLFFFNEDSNCQLPSSKVSIWYSLCVGDEMVLTLLERRDASWGDWSR